MEAAARLAAATLMAVRRLALPARPSARLLHLLQPEEALEADRSAAGRRMQRFGMVGPQKPALTWRHDLPDERALHCDATLVGPTARVREKGV